MSKVQCRNCDEYGHTGKECPKPRDCKLQEARCLQYFQLISFADSRVKCSNCQQMGHTKVRCKNPLVPEDDAGDGGFGDNGGVVEAAGVGDDGGSGWPAQGDTAAVDANSAW